MQQVQNEAERWYPEKICDILERTSSTPKITVYTNSLRSKALDMSKYAFDYAWNKRNKKAYKVLYTIME